MACAQYIGERLGLAEYHININRTIRTPILANVKKYLLKHTHILSSMNIRNHLVI